MTRSQLHRFLFFLIAAFVLDQLTKILVSTSLPSPHSVVEVLPVLNIVYELNHGIAFSLGNNLGPYGRWLFVCISLLVSVGLFLWLRQDPQPSRVISFGLIIGGALGNAFDRIYISAVVDWIDFHIGTWHYPTFNIADTAIFIGAVLLIFEAFVGDDKKRA